ncbi:hypothetical protein HYALB_00011691 [Hymenoscyphus albidus]|uniref:Uncharacterized protein n=1 Tax=Hymenoscyphus albidus TaxID=595503 RepID=A0A9N9LU86_9HELO|nr:hypothetical protein HYALB_00011691 [Hymenoscyphus albidus]
MYLRYAGSAGTMSNGEQRANGLLSTPPRPRYIQRTEKTPPGRRRAGMAMAMAMAMALYGPRRQCSRKEPGCTYRVGDQMNPRV